jgi:AraC-like DNA-binding protein
MASLTVDWIQLASAVGALQGLLLTMALATQRTNRTANRLLAALMAAFTLYLAGSVYYATGLVQAFPHFFGVSYPTPWLFGPLVYLYAVAASDRSWRFTAQSLPHFVPVVIVVLATLPFDFMSAADKLAMFARMATGDVPRALAMLDPTKFVSGLAYSVATVLHLRRHRRTILNSYSNTERVNLRWLLALCTAAFGIWLLALALHVADVSAGLREEHISLAMAILVYAIGYMGMRQPEVFRYETAEYPVPPQASAATASPPLEQSVFEAVAPPPRYERSGLGDEETERLKKSLLDVMERERPWTDSELTLADLAARLGSSPHKLSETLNSALGLTFYDFVNGYRVREVQRRIEAGEARALKMLALAMDAGFASKSTFNQAFKKHTSQTPTSFRQGVGA